MQRSAAEPGLRARYLIFLAFFLSGASGLVLQVLWLRMLKLVFGSTALATSTVLSAFMGGLALGSWVFGRVADRYANKLRLYGLLELGVGATAVALPWLFDLATPLYTAIYRAQLSAGTPHVGALASFGLCFSLLMIPTTLMGGTLPVLSAHLIAERETLGQRLGMLYGLNTLGAMTGCALAGFVLIRLLGQSNTVLLAAAMYLLIGGAFLIYSKARSPAQPGVPGPSAGTSAQTGEEPSPALVKWVLVAYGLSGMASLGYEVAWTRMLVYFVGLDTYAFTAMLTVFLLGVGLGSYLYTRFWDPQQNLLLRLAALQLGIGLTAAGSILVFSQMRHLNELALEWDLVRTTWGGLVALKFVDALVAIGLPTLLMGAAFPLAGRIVTSLLHKGRSIGNVYSVNTVGSIAGAFLAGFVLVPQLGVQETVLALAGVHLTVGLALWCRAHVRLRVGAWATGAGVVAAWLAMAAWVSRTPMIQWTPGFHDEEFGYELLYTQDGVAATVSVLERANGIRELNLDGKSTAFTNYSDIQVHQFLGHLPLLLSPALGPARVLVVGFGLGSTAWSCLQHPVDTVDCVELVREEQETARFFQEHNRDVLKHPRFRWIDGDGRNYLLATDRQYDVISINAIHPRFSPSLYTSDFYELVRARLAPNGLVCAWITLHGLTYADYQLLLGSMLEVFPETTLWDVNSQHMVLIGGPQPLRVNYALWQERIREPPVRSHLAEVHLEHPHALLSHFMLDAAALHTFVGNAPLNSDDRPRVEFGHGIAATSKADIFNALMRRRTSILSLLTDLPPDKSARQELYDDVARYHYAMQHALPGRFFLSVTHDRERATQLLRKALVIWPENRAFAHMLGRSERIARSPRTPEFQRKRAEGWLHERRERWDLAMQAYRQAAAAAPRSPGVYRSLAAAGARSGDLATAVEALTQLRQIDDRPEYARWQMALEAQQQLVAGAGDTARVRLGRRELSLARGELKTELFIARAHNEVGLPRLAAAILDSAARRHQESPRLYEAIGINYVSMGRFRQAERAFARVLELDPGRQQARAQLDMLYRNVGAQIHPDEGSKFEP